MRVLICDDIFPAMIEILTRLLPDEEIRACRQEQVAREAVWAEVLIPSMTRITAEMINAAPDLKLIQQFGVGLEGVDIRAATKRGISQKWAINSRQSLCHAKETMLAKTSRIREYSTKIRVRSRLEPSTSATHGTRTR